ncbi:tyrosine phosphatase family protein [Xylanimonas ulmi]|uniref:Tyrosine phosphatase family protein n=1 Tax=Xylanimonas ulmi TaxID=228973 RepID=A0A4Q7LZ99_9MICO|nr:tyrosine phosphatase family protein [Xylanibacterium ulmi]
MRELHWGGGRNLRDLGGLPTLLSPTGRTVSRRIARGARRETVTAAGWQAASAWGIRSIIDLRNGPEAGSREGDMGDEPPAEVSVISAPTEDQSHPEFRRVCMPILDSPEYWQHNVRILPQHVRRALMAVAEAKPGILVHCAAGRDRTGMISALLLAHAGVNADDVFHDYALAVRAMAGTAAHGEPVQDRQATWTTHQVDTWLSANEGHVRAFATASQDTLDELDVDKPTRTRLRALLTEPTLSN